MATSQESRELADKALADQDAERENVFQCGRVSMRSSEHQNLSNFISPSW